MHALSADLDRGATRALSQQRAQAPSLCDGWNSGEKSVCFAELQAKVFCSRQQSPLATLHRPGQGAAGADGVQAIKVTELSRSEHDLRILYAAKRSQGKKGFIFQPLFLTVQSFKQPLAADRACGAAMPAAEIIFRQRLSAQGVGVVK